MGRIFLAAALLVSAAAAKTFTLEQESRPDVDPAHVGLWGRSYGGYLTALGLARASNLFSAGVDFHGVHDWPARAGSAAGNAASSAASETARPEAARIAFESSPVASVKTWKSPVLLIQGDDDRNLAFSETVTLARRCGNRAFTLSN